MRTTIRDWRELSVGPMHSQYVFSRHEIYISIIHIYSYTQGMSDLLAPVLCEIDNESETFWCFVGLMQRAIFVCTPTDNDIDKNLVCSLNCKISNYFIALFRNINFEFGIL